MLANAPQDRQVMVNFFQPPLELRRYFTTFYFMDFSGDSSDAVVDYLHPEWANLRFFSGNGPDAENADGVRVSGVTFYATGPSSKAVRFAIAPPTRMWGVGLLPLGWAKFVRCDADSLADALTDGMTHPAFAEFIPLAASVFGEKPDLAGELARITDFFRARIDAPVVDELKIVSMHEAVVDPEVSTVAALVDNTWINQRTLERIGHRVFGFSPKLLLRRQRFLRSLAHYVMEPGHKWIGSIDEQYHDQSQFVRDFKAFMGMTPRQYAALDKPILGAFMRERMRVAGQAVQGLDSPDGGGRV